METLAEKIKRKHETPYQKVAREFDTVVEYVYQIACGTREPKRGKGLKIKQRLTEIANQK